MKDTEQLVQITVKWYAVDRLSVIKLLIVNNRLSNQSRDSEPSRMLVMKFSFSFRMYAGPTFHWNSGALDVWSIF